MDSKDSFVLCELTTPDYAEILDVWRRAGLSIRAAGRDGPTAFARQMVLGYQRVVGLRIAIRDPLEDAPGPSEGACPDGRLVAVAVLTHDGRKGWINRLAVDPTYRRRGLAGRLIAEAERWFAEEEELEVWAALIESENVPSLALFDDLGYHRLDVVYVTKRTRPDA